MYIEKNTISNLSESDIFLPDLICPICNYIIINPVQCNKCDNCFCKKCVSGRVECPKGCGDVDLRKSKFMLKLLSKLEFNCKNGCKQKVTYHSLEKHYLQDCPYINNPKDISLLDKNVNSLNQEIGKLTLDSNLPNINSKEGYIESKLHQHLLIKDNGKRESFSCKICKKSNSNLKNMICYYCDKCDFDICEKCLKSE